MVNIQKFIELVRSNPCLYDIFHEEFRNVSKKEKMWNKIGRELGESGEQVKKRWKNLKDTYAKHVRSKEASTEGRLELPLRKWIWGEPMAFIRPFLNSSLKANSYSKHASMEDDGVEKTLQSSEIKVEPEEDEHFTIQSIQDESLIDENSLGVFQQELESTQPHCSYQEYKEHKKYEIPKAKAKVNKKRKSDSLFVGELMKHFDNKQALEYDATDLLLLAYSKTIKSFSRKRQIITKMKIGQLIMEQELLHLDEFTNTNSLKKDTNMDSSDSDT